MLTIFLYTFSFYIFKKPLSITCSYAYYPGYFLKGSILQTASDDFYLLGGHTHTHTQHMGTHVQKQMDDFPKCFKLWIVVIFEKETSLMGENTEAVSAQCIVGDVSLPDL